MLLWATTCFVEVSAGFAGVKNDIRVARRERRLPLRLAKSPDDVAAVLLHDLPRQYRHDLDWSIYADDITFDDPVTHLRGKLRYRGMIAVLRLLVAVAFVPHTCTFLVQRISWDVSHVTTDWSSSGQTRWGSLVNISGTDIFHLTGPNKTSNAYQVRRHQSTWHQSPLQVWHSLWIPPTSH
uniref:Uncharacterized protein n=1 Tax=Compsopogon caeruleus TaxID=31354 RepID=A0A7S1TE68_9RHOD|mmetsp:Transcript_1937/g.3498  ORF Transcript_1937/g.3498 Transcript_1937/m.3498 type:complete len:181 (+) Transcript_1937:554-1096(+)